MYDAPHLIQTSGNHDILFYLWDAPNIKYELLTFQAKNSPLNKLDNNEEVTTILKFHVRKSNIVDRALLITCLPCTPRFCWRRIYPYTNFHTNDLWRNQSGLAWDTQRDWPRLNHLHHSQVFSNLWRNPTYPVSISVNYGALCLKSQQFKASVKLDRVVPTMGMRGQLPKQWRKSQRTHFGLQSCYNY